MYSFCILKYQVWSIKTLDYNSAVLFLIDYF